MTPEKPRVYLSADACYLRDGQVLGAVQGEPRLSLPPLSERHSILERLVGENPPAPRLFTGFVALNPSFKGNTSATYLTQVARYLADWLFHFGDLPSQYAPIAAASQIASRYCDAEAALPRDGTRPLIVRQELARLEKECEQLWRIADDSSTSTTRGKGARRQDMIPCGRRGSRVISLPTLEINHAEQRALAWILSRYDGALKVDFWSHVLSDRSVGEALCCYRDPHWRQERGSEPLSSATICLRMTALQHFRDVIARTYDVQFSDSLPRKPRVGERHRVVIEPQELDQVAASLAEACRQQPAYLARRNDLIFDLLYTTGMRVSALVSLTPGDLSISKGVIRVREKGDKTRELPLSPATIKKIEPFLAERVSHLLAMGAARDSQAPLFHTRRGKPLNRAWTFAIVETIGKRAGLEARLGPHTIRRSMACALYDNGAPLHAIQQLLGHRSPLTTSRYLAYGTRSVEQTLRSYHPWSQNSPIQSPRSNEERVTKTTFSPAGRDAPGAPSLKMCAGVRVSRPDPGYLRTLVGDSVNQPSILTTFAAGEPELRARTRKNYETDCKHFISERLHDLELPPECAAVHRAALTHHLADRVDWFVRTDQISEEEGRLLFQEILKVKDRPLPLLPHFTGKTRALLKLLAGIEESVNDQGSRLRIPSIMLQDSDKNRGKRVDALTRGVFHKGRAGLTVAFWREIFHSEKAREVFNAAVLRGAQLSSLERCLSSLRAFGRIVLRRYNISGLSGELGTQLPSIRTTQEPRPQKILTVEEVNAVFHSLNRLCKAGQEQEKKRALRDRAMFMVFYSTAARVGAITALRWKDVDLRRSTVYLREKGGKEVILPLLPVVARALKEYKAIDSRGDRFIFRAPRGGMLATKQVQRILTRIVSEAGIEVSMRGTSAIGAHTLRRSTVVHMINNGAPLFELKSLLGHRRVEHTSRYAMHGTVHLAELLHKCLPGFSGNHDCKR